MFKDNLQKQRERFKEVFKDTIECCHKEPQLYEALQQSLKEQKLYKNFTYLEESSKQTSSLNNIRITKHRTFEAARLLTKDFPNKKIAVLNFASATNPGGGVLQGASAQEECLCRASFLQPCLSTPFLIDCFYNENRKLQNPLHNDWTIYTPNVIVYKTDDKSYTKLAPKEYYQVDVISCAAPNLREKPNNQFNTEFAEAVSITPTQLYQLHFNRADAIIQTALANKVDILVLGAFGCGAFKNNPAVVAKAYYDVLKYCADKFTLIEFAIYCNSYEDINYQAFEEQFERKQYF